MPLLHLVYTIVTPCYMAYLIIILIAFIEFRIVQLAVSLLKSYSDCAFSVAAPTLWNKFLLEILNLF